MMATIISMKVKSDDNLIGNSYKVFVNSDVKESGKKYSKGKSSLDLSPSYNPTSSNIRRHRHSAIGRDQHEFINTKLKSYSSENSLTTSSNYELVEKNHQSKIRVSTESISNEAHENPKIIIRLHSEDYQERRRISEIIRNLLRRRPPLDYLREKGILKDEPVFGSDLVILCAREGQNVPTIVRVCVQVIDQHLDADGLYRICGNLSEVQKLRFQVNNGNYQGIKSQNSVHVITGLLKLFLRDLREPLFPFDLFNSFMKSVAITDKDRRCKFLSGLIKQLPASNNQTLKFILAHLLRVVDHQDQNRMKLQNLAIVFGPSLMWPRSETKDLNYDMMLRVNCNKVVEELLVEFKVLFSE
ncbi:rho GTPase-activating protein 15-like [Brevipalpus obovatus]|uniref:rho GTPase-activating protein 15-like n=1 Tax=Brevipalpus obovatus TaxID=246614 RepID=UPI003D9DC2BB